MWVHGPFPAGKFSDLRIFRSGMKEELDMGEKVIADGTYQDESCVLATHILHEYKKLHSIVRARHETINGRFKNFFVLAHKFRHNPALHSFCFHTVANLTQLLMRDTDPPFLLSV